MRKNETYLRDPKDKFCSFEILSEASCVDRLMKNLGIQIINFSPQAGFPRFSRNRLLSTTKQLTQSLNIHVAWHPGQWNAHLLAEATENGIIRLTLSLGCV